MALNDPRVSAVAGGITYIRRYQMWNTWDIGASEQRQHIIDWVANVARSAPGGKLKNLVLSCHGLPGMLWLGQGFTKDHLGLFAAWRGLIEKIWLPNCLVAHIPTSTEQVQFDRSYPGWGVSDGNMFCSGLAKQVQCYVVAPTESQCESTTSVPFGQMTSFEGLVLSYGPSGNVTWQNRNPSIWTNAAGQCVPVPD